MRFTSLQKLITFTLLAIGYSNFSFAQDALAPSLAVSQSRLEIELGSGQNQAFESVAVMNVGSEPQAILVTMNNWDLDESNLFRVQPPSPQSLDQWMVVNPLRFVLEPGASQTIRFAVRPRVTPEVGEHRAMVFFNQDLDAEINAGKTLVFNIGLPVYTYVGDYARSTEINNVEFTQGENNTGEIVIQATNTGNAHSRAEGFFGYWRRDNFPGIDAASALLREEARIRADGAGTGLIYYGKLNSVALLPGTQRDIPTELATPAESGSHYMVVSATFGDTEISELFEL